MLPWYLGKFFCPFTQKNVAYERPKMQVIKDTNSKKPLKPLLMAHLKHSLRSYFKTPFVTVSNGFFSLEKNFFCFSRKLNRKKAISTLVK